MTIESRGVFPFGQPVKLCNASGSGTRPVFILGAYPSALHVSWTPPQPYRRVQAIAIDNEPEAFWNGADEDTRVEAWKKAIRFDDERWGKISSAGALNGSSGVWVIENVLTPLRVSRGEAWITDALDTYRCSEGLADRIRDTYDPFASSVGLTRARLLPHPSESDIIREALQRHGSRLRQELETARPDKIVTLGNAALAVIRELLPRAGGADTRRLEANEAYGTPVKLRMGERNLDLIPLAHPAAPAPYQAAHSRWRTTR